MKLTRELQIEDKSINDGIYTFSVCSDAPYERYCEEFGVYDEVLTISEDAIDFSRLNSGSCAFLKDHNMEEVLGVITKSWIEGNKLKVNVKFSERPEVQGYVKDIEQGIMTATSIGYNIDSYHFETVNGKKTMYVDKYLIFEASLVGVAADFTVGFNRSLDIKEEDMKKEEEKPVEETEEKSSKAVEETDEKPVEAAEEKPAENEAEKAEEEATADEEKEEKACEKKECDEPEEANEDDEIRSLGDLVNQRALADRFIAEKRSLVDFKAEIKNLSNNKNLKDNKDTMEKFNILRAIQINTRGYRGDVTSVNEYNISEENKRKYNVNDADIVVTRDQLRAIDGSEALNQVQYKPGMYTENLRPQNVIEKTGCTAVAVNGPSISFAVCTSGATAGFVGLNNQIPSSNMEWTLKQMTPKKLGSFIEVDYAATLQDEPSVRDIVTTDIIRGLDQAKDEAILVGTGENNQPKGIFATSGVNEYDIANAFSLSGVQNMEKGIRDSNDFTDELAWVMNSTNYYKYARTPISAVEVNEFLIDRKDRKMIGHPVYICNKLNDNQIVLGNFNELLVANFDAIKLKIVDDVLLSRAGAVEIQAFETFDCLCRRPKSFSITKASV